MNADPCNHVAELVDRSITIAETRSDGLESLRDIKASNSMQSHLIFPVDHIMSVGAAASTACLEQADAAVPGGFLTASTGRRAAA